jgi:hypothetical protein
MCRHSVTCFCHCRPVLETTGGHSTSRLRIVTRGIGVQRLNQLPWSRNLFDQCASEAELSEEVSQELGRSVGDYDEMFECGYLKQYNRNSLQTAATRAASKWYRAVDDPGCHRLLKL